MTAELPAVKGDGDLAVWRESSRTTRSGRWPVNAFTSRSTGKQEGRGSTPTRFPATEFERSSKGPRIS